MRASRLVIVTILAAACGDNSGSSGPFDKLPVDGTFKDSGLSAPVHVARDKYGVAHIEGDTTADVAYVQGYVMAHDRLPQMDVLRRYGAGTLSELFGALDPSIIDTDLEMRVHRMKPLAEESWAMLQASTDPSDQEIVQLLSRFTDGVNAYAKDVQSGRWTLDPNILVSFDPDRFTPWTPVDSLILGRFQAFALSWTTPVELDLTEAYQKLSAKFPAAIVKDLLKIKPVGHIPTIDGFPNVDTDSGSRSDGGRAAARTAARIANANGVQRPQVPQALLDQAKTFFHRGIHTGPLGALGPHAFMAPYAGSNNWAVSPMLTGGKALLATDQHLQLPNPSIFYPTHLIVKGKLDALGITFPGIPGIILGTNGDLAWAATVSYHDVNDIYMETIAPCGSGSCVAFKGQQVPITTFTETFNIGALGTITGTKTATYEVVPHHGPIIPTIVNHEVVPRTAATALSVKYTGYDPSFEIRAVWNLAHAATVDDGFKAMKDYHFGSQNWTMIDSSGNIGWTTHAAVPWRSPASYTWDPITNPTGIAPFFVMPGDGTTEWEGLMSSRYVPHAINPAKGYIATANADPVGATFDDNALNQPMVDGRPLYAGVTYAAGVREERISKLIETGGTALTLDDMARIQHDSNSTVGMKLMAPVVTALNILDDPTGAPADAAQYVLGLSTQDRARLTTAKQLLSAWTGATPVAAGADSSATTIFNAWMHFFIERSIKDEFASVNFDVWRLEQNATVRIIYSMLVEPNELVKSNQTGQPQICDDVSTNGPDDSCSKMILKAMVDAMAGLEQVYGSTDASTWRWGKLHTLTIKPLFPNAALNLGPFEKAGDNFVINRADQGWEDLDFSQYADGPAQRFLAEAAPGAKIKVKWQLPGGAIYDSRDKHYRDLLDNYYIPQVHFDAPYSVDEIVAAGETRWEFSK